MPSHRGMILALMLCALVGTYAQPATGDVLINEHMAFNAMTRADEYGEYPDWIEIFNTGTGPVDLNGYGLSDDPTEPFKWTFPEAPLPPGEPLLVYASDRDQRTWYDWETLIDWGATWRYRVNTTAPPANWRAPAFNDSSWNAGPSGFGYGDGDDSTLVANCISLCARITFTLTDPADVAHLYLHVDYDDAFVAYLNGAEITRANIGDPGEPPAWDANADEDHEARIYAGGLPETFEILGAQSELVAGTNVLAIEVHNASFGSTDLSLIPFFTVAWTMPAAGGGPAELIRFTLPHLHANFKIDASGENLLLTAPGGILADLIATGVAIPDISRGRIPDGGTEWLLLADPTPEASNGLIGFEEQAGAPTFSPAGGLYGGPISVSMDAAHPVYEITYSTDGSVPTSSSIPYTGPITISAAARALRACTFVPGMLPSAVTTHTYIIADEAELPTVSVVTAPENLFDPEIGIYTYGNYENYYLDWERPAHIEFFETEGATAFAGDIGIKIHGGHSRTYPQKTLRILMREGYGTAAIEYPLFDEKNIASFTALLLRNAGNDWCRAHLRDAVMHRIIASTTVDRQAYRPTRVFLNGTYWGIHHLRERIDVDYLAANRGIDSDAVDLLTNRNEVVAGSNEHYLAMLSYIEQYGLRQDGTFHYIQTQMNTENFATYYIHEVFFGNTDWPTGNTRYWRARTPQGRWHWIFFDGDFGLGLAESYTHNTLAFALDPAGTSHNLPYSTYLMRMLLENPGYRSDFINRYADHLNTNFTPGHTLPILDGIAAGLLPEIERHYQRWGHDPQTWEDEITVARTYLTFRPAYARQHILQQFGLSGMYNLTLGISPPGAGRIALTACAVDSAWAGAYFRNVPMTLTAFPAYGYVFEAWSDPELLPEASVTIAPDADFTVTAIFAPTPPPPDSMAVINEINYNSSDEFDPGDWIELYNRAATPMDLSAWIFKDEENQHAFVFPANFHLPVDGYVILCRDTTMFREHFPEATPLLGNLEFGLSGGGEALRLYNAAGVRCDSVRYDDDPPWPPQPDGNGPTLELRDPILDNALAASWVASPGCGSPGRVNSVLDPADSDEGTSEAGSVTLGPPFPNPCSAQTTLTFALDRPRAVELALYDVLGRRVTTLVRGILPAGAHAAQWDGRDAQGRPVRAGIYWARLEAGTTEHTRRILLLH